MRLSPSQVRLIAAEVRRHFGPAARVRLFGSRVDDLRRGGDIDLWVETDLDDGAAFAAEGRLYAVLQRLLGERRIDIVVHRRGSPMRSIDRVALQDGVGL